MTRLFLVFPLVSLSLGVTQHHSATAREKRQTAECTDGSTCTRLSDCAWAVNRKDTLFRKNLKRGDSEREDIMKELDDSLCNNKEEGYWKVCCPAACSEPLPASDSFEQTGLLMHNMMPERRGFPLVLNQSLCEGAQNKADELAEEDNVKCGKEDFKKECHTNRTELGELGENLSYFGPLTYPDGRTEALEKPNAAAVVKEWYNEKYVGHPKYNATGFNHYTQVVWEGSTGLCMATAKSAASGAWYTVGIYYPGQREGERQDNVKVSTGAVCCGNYEVPLPPVADDNYFNPCNECGKKEDQCGGMCTWNTDPVQAAINKSVKVEVNTCF